jgi:hypothetical protein
MWKVVHSSGYHRTEPKGLVVLFGKNHAACIADLQRSSQLLNLLGLGSQATHHFPNDLPRDKSGLNLENTQHLYKVIFKIKEILQVRVFHRTVMLYHRTSSTFI